MWNKLKPTLVCLFIGLVFSGTALAEKHHKHARTRVTTFESYFSSESFADFLNPGVNLGEDFSPLFQKKNGATWTISSVLLILPKTNRSPGGVISFGNDLASIAFDANTFVTSTFIHYGSFQPLVLLVFYQGQGQVAVVPEASAGVMMALGLPLLGWLAWRRQRLG
jgi:hypothetical protein